MADPQMTASDGTQPSQPPESLEELLAQATGYYAQKNYRTAAELYSRATELQAKVNGELSIKNADLLYLYGRCLYHVAVEKSDVLGSKVAGEKPGPNPGASAAGGPSKKPNGRSAREDRVAEEAIAAVATDTEQSPIPEPGTTENKPYFQFTGDENFVDSEEEDAEGQNAEQGAAEEEDDDFSNAFEILDLARVLLQRRLEEAEGSASEKGKSAGESEVTKQLRERLADTHDLQAEISLEGEQFQSAVNDLKAALALKEGLYTQDSSLIAEMHYKLSLALEFSSVTQQKDEQGEVDQSQAAYVDEKMREEAAQQMEAAIASCRLRIDKEQKALEAGTTEGTGARSKITKKSIDEVREMVQDMEQRLVELRQPPVSINDPKGTGSVDGATPLSGILGSILGESADAQRTRLEQASKEARDLTDLVKRKKPELPVQNATGSEGTSKQGSKRKVGFAEEVEEIGTGKKAKVEDGT